jgi:hypothetical protein
MKSRLSSKKIVLYMQQTCDSVDTMGHLFDKRLEVFRKHNVR